MVERVNPAGDRAVYQQIADHLRERIAREEPGPGGQLPSESQLMNDYGVSRVTARRALRVLVTEGLVVAEHGRGWFVRRQPPIRRLGSDRFARRHEGRAAVTVDLDANNLPFDLPFDVDVISIGPGPAPAEVALRLFIKENATVLVRSRRYLVDGRPVEAATSYIPLDIADGTPMTQENSGPGGIYARMEDKGFNFEAYDEEITARLPSPDEARLLALPPASPVLHLVRTAIASGRAVEVCDTVMDAAAFVLHYRLPADLP